MNKPKNFVNIKSLLTKINKINTPYFQSNNKIKKISTEKEQSKKSSLNKLNDKSKTKEDINLNNYSINNYSINKIQNNFQHKRSFSKGIFNNINNYNLQKKFGLNTNEDNFPIKNTKKNGIILNKINIFKNVKFRKPLFTKSHMEKNNNSNNSSTVQSLSSLNMTSTDITTSTKRKKDIMDKSKIMLFNPNNNIISRQNKYNLTNFNINKIQNTNTIYQYYTNIKNTFNKKQNINKSNVIKMNRSSSKKNNIVYDKKREGKKEIMKGNNNLYLNNIANFTNKNEKLGGTIISDDSVFNISKRRSSSGTHNDSSKISKGSNSYDKKTKSISLDYTISDDEIQTNRRKNMNKINIENKVENKDEHQEEKEEDINFNNLEFKNFCDNLSAKLFGNK